MWPASTYVPRQAETILARQPHIQQHKIGQFSFHERPQSVTAAEIGHAKSLLCQKYRQEVALDCLVFHNRNVQIRLHTLAPHPEYQAVIMSGSQRQRRRTG
jgi:hypothetical protein